MRDAPMRARREKRPSVRKTETQASLEQRSAKPKRDANDAATKEMLCCLTLELSGGGAVRLERVVRHAR
jgi:hypothetical protein